MNQRRTGYQLHIGTASMLLVFITLCLVSFAVLSLVNANADYKLSVKLAEKTSAYYEAVSEAEEYIHEVDDRLWKRYASSSYMFSSNDEMFFSYFNVSEDDPTLTKQFVISGTQYLEVTLEILCPDWDTYHAYLNQHGTWMPLYRIVSYKVVTDESSMDFDEPLLNVPH